MATRPDDAGSTPTATPTPPPSEGAPSFEDAFAAAAKDDVPGETVEPGAAPAAEPSGEPAKEPAKEPAAEPGAAPAAEPGAAPAAEPGEPAKEPAKEPAAEPGAAPAAEPAKEPAKEPAPNIADEIARGVAEALKQSQPAPAAQPQEEQPQLYSEEDQAILTEYEKNWPDVSQAEAIKRRGEYHDLLKYTFSEVHKFYAPYIQQIAAMGNTLHTQELTSAVPDYTPALEEDVTKWIDTQPAYLQTAYKQVMQTGTSEEVADLIGRYRGATGTAPAPKEAAPAATAPAAEPAKQPAKTELSNLAKQAAESLAPVSSDRTQVPAGEDTGDFKSAFARYAAEELPPTT